MINKDEDPVAGQDVNSEEIFSDEKTDRKIHQHLSDKNDVISEQDIKNARTDFNEKSAEGLGQNVSSEESGNDKNDTEDNKHTEEKKEAHPLITPWNILGS